MSQYEDKRQDPLEAAIERGNRRRQEILDAGGGCVSASEAAARLAIEPEELGERRELWTVLALPKTGEYAYPVWQFDDSTRDGLLPGLRHVLASFCVESSYMRAEWLLAHDEDLDGMRPIDALRAGEVRRVSGLAAAYGEQGAR